MNINLLGRFNTFFSQQMECTMPRKQIAIAIITIALSFNAHAGAYKWTSGSGMGVTEYAVDDGNGNGLIISCSSDSAISAEATIHGHVFQSATQPGFDMIVDGVRHRNPFHTECRVCSANFISSFWEQFRHANNLQIAIDDFTFNLPTQNLREITLPHDSELTSCKTDW